MQATIIMTCECGNTESIALKRSVDEVDDYIEITDSFESSQRFNAHQSYPDATGITCTKCGKFQEVLI